MLKQLGLIRIRLLTNNPAKCDALASFLPRDETPVSFV